MKKLVYGLCASAALIVGSASAQTVLKASHQFPGGKGDIRDEMVQLIAREVKAANVGLEIQVFPAASLYKPNDQWNAITRGLLDMTSLPLDYASGRHPEFSATLMPGLVGNFDRAMRLNNSPFMQDIKAIIEKAGALVIADAWLSGAFASKKTCITTPASIKGQVVRAAGPAFEEMLIAAGASISSMPSSEIYTGMQTGVLDAANTSSASFVSYRLFEQRAVGVLLHGFEDQRRIGGRVRGMVGAHRFEVARVGNDDTVLAQAFQGADGVLRSQGIIQRFVYRFGVHVVVVTLSQGIFSTRHLSLG